jgi:hypothetical protein
VFRMNRILPRGVVSTLFASTLVLVGVYSIPQSVLAAAIDPKEIWLSGVDPVVLHDRDKNAADNDFMELFKFGSSWARASARV